MSLRFVKAYSGNSIWDIQTQINDDIDKTHWAQGDRVKRVHWRLLSSSMSVTRNGLLDYPVALATFEEED